MSDTSKSFLQRFRSYVGYGVFSCVLLAVPLFAIDWLIKNLPGVDKFLEFAHGLEQPLFGVLIGLGLLVLVLGVMGWVVRRYLWGWLSHLPIIGTVLTSGQQFARAMRHVDRESRELVVWMPQRWYRSLGVIVSHTWDADGTEFATLYVLYGAGQFQGNQICSVPAGDLVYPGWTVDEAIVFSSSGGAVVPEVSSRAPAEE